MNLVVVGMGYVGIPAAALFADAGHNVTGVQRRSKRSAWKIDHLNAGKSPIGGDEPGLEELIARVVEKGSFQVTDDLSAYKDADVILIDVQTPVDDEHKPRYESLQQVSRDIGERMKKGALIGVESTVAPGTTEHVVKPILEEASGMKAGEDFSLMFSYERVTVGRLLHNIKYMPRIVGGYTPECTRRGVDLYSSIVEAEIYPTDILTAEVSKVTENAYRDVNIAFANEIALIAESLGVNIHEVRRYVNSLPNDPSDPTKNPIRNMHIPGAGVGGHCLPKDSWLLKYGLDTYGKTKVDTPIITGSRHVNDYMPIHMRNLVIQALRDHGVELSSSKICILGYAFLENSDDTRNTPAKPLYDLLKKQCKKVTIHDPHTKTDNVTSDLTEALTGANCLALVTAHKEYHEIDLDWLKETMQTPIIVDGRYVFNPKECLEKGFTYRGVGVGKRNQTIR